MLAARKLGQAQPGRAQHRPYAPREEGVADREGFEPPEDLRPRPVSSGVP
jgi:hypothetical protein